jgi:hypothetical protein
MGSVLNGGHHGRIFGVTGEDENAKFWRNGQKPSAGISDGGIGKLDVKQHHMWACIAGRRLGTSATVPASPTIVRSGSR